MIVPDVLFCLARQFDWNEAALAAQSYMKPFPVLGLQVASDVSGM